MQIDGVKENIYNRKKHVLKQGLQRITPGRLTFIFKANGIYRNTFSITDTFFTGKWQERQRHCL